MDLVNGKSMFRVVLIAVLFVLTLSLHAWAQDLDGDGIEDTIDNCPTVFNADQLDSNGDGIGDACTAYHCVTNSTELHQVLKVAEGNDRYDIIMIEQGMYDSTVGFGSLTDDVYGMSLAGGYYDGCTARTINPANTVLFSSVSTATKPVLYIGKSNVVNIGFYNVAKASVEGLTIKSGGYSGVSINLGGEINFSHNVISDNSYISNCGNSLRSRKIVVNGNIITGNRSEIAGGGICIYGESGDVFIDGNIITNNTVYNTTTLAAKGAGLYIDNVAYAAITNNVIVGNSITSTSGSAYGGGIYISNMQYTAKSKSLTLTNNTITGNSSSAPGTRSSGGGLYYETHLVDVNIYNNIFWGNSAYNYADFVSSNPFIFSIANIFNNDFDPAKVYIDPSNNLGNNINVDPLFANAANDDYHLTASSLVINKGNNAAPSMLGKDVFSNSRIAEGIVDIGAAEYNPVTLSFSVTPNTGFVPMTVRFTDQSSSTHGLIVGWAWDFNNDGITDSVEKNPTYTYGSVGSYAVRLTVTDAAGGVNTLVKESYVKVGDNSDSDGDGISDVTDNCPHTYNPQQIDQDSDGIGDACQNYFNLLSQVLYSSGLKSSIASEQNVVDKTTISKDGILNLGTTVNKANGVFNILSFKSNTEASKLSAVFLNFYATNFTKGASASITVYAYAADGKTALSTKSVNFTAVPGWNKVNLTSLMHLMDGFGFMKFRITTTGAFDVSEASFTQLIDSQEVAVTPQELDYGVTGIGSSKIMSISVTNSGSGNLKIVKIIPPETLFFSVASDGCTGLMLPASASCSVTINLSRTDAGTYFDQIKVVSNDEDHPVTRIRLNAAYQTADLTVQVLEGGWETVYLDNAIVAVTDAIGTFFKYVGDLNSGYYWGKATFNRLRPGSFSATFEHKGFVTKRVEGTLVSGANTLTVNLDRANIQLSITSPADGAVVSTSPILVTGGASSVVNLTVNGIQVNIANGEYLTSVPLAEGLNEISVVAVGSLQETVTKKVYVRLATKGNISGVVKNAQNGLPLSAAIVSVTDSAGLIYNATTSGDGVFTFTDLPIGAFSGTITKDTYEPYVLSGTVSFGDASQITASLIHVAPVLSNIIEKNLTLDSATITWDTDNQTTSKIEYGETTSYGSSASDGAFAINHSLILTGLKPGTTYHYRVASTNGYNITTTSVDKTFVTPLFSVKNLNDSGNITLMEVSGNYDAKKSDGSVNDLPRQTISQEYFKTHPDKDFLVFFSTFDYAMPELGAQGFYSEVKNDILGINRSLFNNTVLYGSAGMLQGTIDMGSITALAANPYGPKLDEILTVLNHEIGHRWGSYVRFKNPDGSLDSALLGKDSAHWSYLLDSKGSLMYGNGWKDNGNGTFTSVSKQSGYSPLDLYLMGMIPKEQVPPMLLIDNPAIDKTQLSQLGATVSGTARTVTIDDIIAAEGARVPGSATSQKQFNVGFVLLSRPGDNTVAAAQAIETVRKAWAGRFAELTQGAGGIANVPATLDVTIDSPADGTTISGPDVTVTGTIINSRGAETGVTVNGIPATVSGNRFIVNHVPLTEGSNSIAITATDANGLTATVTRSVTAQVGNYIRITSNIESGTGPLNILLRLDGSFNIANPQISVTGPVAVTVQAGTQENEYAVNLAVEGTYAVTVTATGPDGQAYSDTVTITVINRTQLQNLLKAKWEGMKQKIATGDTVGAGSYFSEETRDMFQAIFDDPSIETMSRLDEISEIKIYTIQNDTAQGGAIRQEDDGIYAYPVNFTRDENGMWRIYGF